MTMIKSKGMKMSMCADKLKYLLLVLFSVMGGILLFGCNTVTPEPDPVSYTDVCLFVSAGGKSADL